MKGVCMSSTLNPLLEALTYLYRRANGLRISAEVDLLKRRFPSSADRISSLLKPICKLEYELDKSLVFDKASLQLYFGQPQGVPGTRPFGHTIASMFFIADANIPFTVFSDLVNARLNYSLEEKVSEFALGLSFSGLDKDYNVATVEVLFDKVNSFPTSESFKLKILEAFFGYKEHLKRVAAMIQSVIDQLDIHTDICSSILSQFEDNYIAAEMSGEVLSQTINYKIPEDSTLYITPYLFGFNKRTLYSKTDNKNDPVSCYLCLGVYYEDFKEIEATALSPESLAATLKTLSDVNRLEMLCHIKDHVSYGQELADKFKLFPTTVSHHMTKLVSAGFADGAVESRHTYYSINKRNIYLFLTRLMDTLLDGYTPEEE